MVQWWFKKPCKGDESLGDNEQRGWPSEVDNDQLRAIIKADTLATTWEVAKESNIHHSVVIQHLKQIGKMKKLDKWVPHELTENFLKIIILKCHLLLFYTTTNHFSVGLWYAMKSGFYTTNGKGLLNGCTEKKLQSTSQSQNLHPKKVMVTVRWPDAGLIYYSFLNPSETITSEKYAQQINEMHQKL